METSRRTLEKVTYVVTKINEILLLIAISIMFLLVFINVARSILLFKLLIMGGRSFALPDGKYCFSGNGALL